MTSSEWSFHDLSILANLPETAITSIRLAPAQLPAGQLNNIVHLKGLKKLSFERVLFEDEDDLAILQFLPFLQSVDFGGSNITDLGSRYLITCQTIERIRLTNPNISLTSIASCH